MMLFWILGAIVVLGILWVIGAFNGLVSLKNRVDEAWSDIDVQLKRRYDLIPNLVETVKGYAQHERQTLEAVTNARANAINARSGSLQEQAAAENLLSGALKSLFAVAEAYPDLKANRNMMQLSEELTTTENKVAFARQSFNDAVMSYNNKREVFPNSLVAGNFGFLPAQLLDIETPQKREVPKVSFT